MNIPFLDNWLKRHDAGQVQGEPAAEYDPEREAAIAELLSECELLRVRAGQAGLELDDSPASLAALDQLPRAGATTPRSCRGWAMTRVSTSAP